MVSSLVVKNLSANLPPEAKQDTSNVEGGEEEEEEMPFPIQNEV